MHFRLDLQSQFCAKTYPPNQNVLNENYYKAHNSLVNLPFPTERTEKQFIFLKTIQWQYFVLIG